jgi:hypothetical protein
MGFFHISIDYQRLSQQQFLPEENQIPYAHCHYPTHAMTTCLPICPSNIPNFVAYSERRRARQRGRSGRLHSHLGHWLFDNFLPFLGDSNVGHSALLVTRICRTYTQTGPISSILRCYCEFKALNPLRRPSRPQPSVVTLSSRLLHLCAPVDPRPSRAHSPPRVWV